MPGGFDHSIEAVGRGDTMRLAWDVLRPAGQATVVGIAPAGVKVSLPALSLLSEKTLRGCYYGSSDVAAELPGLVRLASSGQIDLAGVVSHVTDLEGIEEALGRLRRGEGARTVAIIDAELAGRAVVPANRAGSTI
jgi:S-(hydroxymethyl)glutathione dehydrogenase / alcohol dehydrogenase